MIFYDTGMRKNHASDKKKNEILSLRIILIYCQTDRTPGDPNWPISHILINSHLRLE